MSDPAEKTADRAPEDAPFQFGTKRLLGLTFLLAVFLGTLVGLYPFSVMMLPFVPLMFLGAALWACLAQLAFGWKSPTLEEALVVCVILYALLSLGLSGLVNPGLAERSQCQNNLKSIAIALHNYHDRYGCFPPAYIADAEGRPMHSWRVLILPFVEHGDIHAQYNFNEPWDGPNNRRLLGMQVPSVFQCPEDRASPTATSYLAVVGPETMWPGSASSKRENCPDGTSNTLMVVETANSGIHWMEPKDLEFADLPMSVNPDSGRGISSLHREESWRPKRPYGANAAMADGCARFLPTGLSSEKLRALLTIKGNEPVDGWDAVHE